MEDTILGQTVFYAISGLQGLMAIIVVGILIISFGLLIISINSKRVLVTTIDVFLVVFFLIGTVLFGSLSIHFWPGIILNPLAMVLIGTPSIVFPVGLIYYVFFVLLSEKF